MFGSDNLEVLISLLGCKVIRGYLVLLLSFPLVSEIGVTLLWTNIDFAWDIIVTPQVMTIIAAL